MVAGIRAALSVLTETPERARHLMLRQGRRDARVNELLALAKANGVRYESLDQQRYRSRLERAELEPGVADQGVLLECRSLTTLDERELLEALDALSEPLVLVLDGIEDPRNLGACLRTANAAGVQAVVLPKRRTAPLSAAALKTAQGGAERLTIAEVSNLARVLKAMKARGFWVVGAAGEAEAGHTSVDYRGKTALVMGSEGSGLKRLTRDLCDHLVSIPMLGSVASLNVSVACGVLLYEAVRQRGEART